MPQATYTKIFLQFDKPFWFSTEVSLYQCYIMSCPCCVRWHCMQMQKEENIPYGKAWTTSVSSQVLVYFLLRSPYVNPEIPRRPSSYSFREISLVTSSSSLLPRFSRMSWRFSKPCFPISQFPNPLIFSSQFGPRTPCSGVHIRTGDHPMSLLIPKT